MPINISNITTVLNAKNAAANSSTSTAELGRLAILANKVNDLRNALTYSSNTEFPAASVSNAGQIVYDSGSSTFYFSTGSDWSSLTLSSGGGGGGATGVTQGTTYGYAAGGRLQSFSATTGIDQYSFASDPIGTEVDDLSVAQYGGTGISSSESGYVSSDSSSVASIQKYDFASTGQGTVAGALSVARRDHAGQVSSSYGYYSGGYAPPTTFYNIIDKFPFASDTTTSTDVGDMTVGRDLCVGQSSSTYGYNSGGAEVTPTGSISSNVIDKFPFASDANATDVGDLTVARGGGAGHSSSTYGYTSGAISPPTGTNVIDKFPFASDANATDVGDLPRSTWNRSGVSSTTQGYIQGGVSGETLDNSVDMFLFASDGNASWGGFLSVDKDGTAGHQY